MTAKPINPISCRFIDASLSRYKKAPYILFQGIFKESDGPKDIHGCPVAGRDTHGSWIIEILGVCLVQFDDEGLIRRNEVYFD
jgi:hypothetical protein